VNGSKTRASFAAQLVIALAASRAAPRQAGAERWLTYNHGYHGDRFSAAAKITP
jgi:hypothetical protein